MSVHKKIYLAFDTSSEVGVVVLFDSEKIYFAESLREKYSHGQLLFSALDQVLAFLKTHTMNLDAVFVGLGPGSFVGLRIALAAALGFCWGRSLPLMGFCSHRAFVFFENLEKQKNIYVATKASGDLCYVSCFGLNPQATRVVPRSEILGTIQNSSDLITNLDFEQAPMQIIQQSGPSPRGVQEACLARILDLGEIVDEINYIKPNYVKAPSVSIPKIFSALRVS